MRTYLQTISTHGVCSMMDDASHCELQFSSVQILNRAQCARVFERVAASEESDLAPRSVQLGAESTLLTLTTMGL
jgi:hypothetical protein